MNLPNTHTRLATALMLALASVGASSASPDRDSVNSILAGWAERPRLGAEQMIAKYGAPQEATAERLIWTKAPPFKRIAVMNLETPHDFPLPHVDYMEHTITYNVPQDKVGALVEFDASSTINRTVGELSARCDLEGHNILTLNLDHDIVMGKKTVAQARQAFGEIVGQDVKGEHPAYVEALQFKPDTMEDAAFSDTPVIPCSPVRVADRKLDKAMVPAGKESDAEILATVIAVDLNEVLAAMEAQKKKVSAPVLDYARMLHAAHGKSMVDTMALGTKMGVTPLDTPAIEKMKIKGAGELAALVPLDGKSFEQAFIRAMQKGHTEALATIDTRLLPKADNAALKAHLTTTRSHIATHLEQANSLAEKMKP